jgi:uncharacterized membrane protein
MNPMEVFMEKEKKNFFSARNIAFLAVLVALVVVLQCFGGSIKIGQTSLSFVLVPIVLGGMLLGVWAGAFLGFVFGFIVLMYGVAGTDVFTNMLFNAQPFMTALICLGKGIMAGVVSALVYKAIAKKNKYVAVFVASALAPITNTGLFIIGAFCMSGTMAELFGYAGSDLVYFLFISCAGINFIVELAINLVCAPALFTVSNVVEKQIVAKVKTKNKANQAD